VLSKPEKDENLNPAFVGIKQRWITFYKSK